MYVRKAVTYERGTSAQLGLVGDVLPTAHMDALLHPLTAWAEAV